MSESKPVRQAIVLNEAEGEHRQTDVGQVIKARSADTEDRFSFTVITDPPGYGGPRAYYHEDTDDVFYVLEGEMMFLIGERRVIEGAGGFVLVPAGTVHAFGNVGPSRSRHITILSPGAFEGYFEELAELRAAGRLDAEASAALSKKYRSDVVGPPLGETLRETQR
jgi:mannose-6-phosphate isomerase-like protein (cupin superfamily)